MFAPCYIQLAESRLDFSQHVRCKEEAVLHWLALHFCLALAKTYHFINALCLSSQKHYRPLQLSLSRSLNTLHQLAVKEHYTHTPGMPNSVNVLHPNALSSVIPNDNSVRHHHHGQAHLISNLPKCKLCGASHPKPVCLKWM